MPDEMILLDAVRHLDPLVLTGLPRGKLTAPQKVRWAAEHFPGTRTLTVMAVEHYSQAILSEQFDAYVWFDETKALTPLGPEHNAPGVPDTDSFGE